MVISKSWYRCRLFPLARVVVVVVVVFRVVYGVTGPTVPHREHDHNVSVLVVELGSAGVTDPLDGDPQELGSTPHEIRERLFCGGRNVVLNLWHRCPLARLARRDPRCMRLPNDDIHGNLPIIARTGRSHAGSHLSGNRFWRVDCIKGDAGEVVFLCRLAGLTAGLALAVLAGNGRRGSWRGSRALLAGRGSLRRGSLRRGSGSAGTGVTRCSHLGFASLWRFGALLQA